MLDFSRSAPSEPRKVLHGASLLVVCVLAGGLTVGGPAAAQQYCSEPVEPYCVSTDSEFETLLQVNRCEDDLMEFEQELNDFEKCIKAQIEAMRQDLNEARQKLEETAKKF